MTRPLARLIVAAMFIVAGAICWGAADVAARMALQHERVATLQPAEADSSGRWGRWIEDTVATTLPGHGASRTASMALSADYWAARYDAIVSSDASNEADAALLLTAANATYRKARREAGARMPTADRLDQVLQGYAGVLKNGGFNRDAAYNYEFVARLRDGVARSKTQVPPRPLTQFATVVSGGLPAGPTVHGTPGTHPPGTKGEEFEIMTPMDYGEREAQPEATPGRPLPRKG
jgi:hypothetical protein